MRSTPENNKDENKDNSNDKSRRYEEKIKIKLKTTAATQEITPSPGKCAQFRGMLTLRGCFPRYGVAEFV